MEKKLCLIIKEIRYIAMMRPKEVDEMASSVGPDKNAPGSALFSQTYLSQYLEFYITM